MEKPIGLAIIKSHLRNHSIAAAGLSHYGHIIGVTTKGSNVGLYPFQCETLIEKAGVGRRERLMGHETEGSKTVADIDCDEILALADPVAEVIVRRGAVL